MPERKVNVGVIDNKTIIQYLNGQLMSDIKIKTDKIKKEVAPETDIKVEEETIIKEEKSITSDENIKTSKKIDKKINKPKDGVKKQEKDQKVISNDITWL